jgi:hypothetical protein
VQVRKLSSARDVEGCVQCHYQDSFENRHT